MTNIVGEKVDRIPYGHEKTRRWVCDSETDTCGDCGVRFGEPHKDLCDLEECRLCGGQYLTCGCES